MSKCLCKYSLKERSLEVRQGNLVFEKVDAIVNAANGKLKHLGGLAWAIVKHGGQSIQDESRALVERNGQVATGTAVVTDSGKLPCLAIIHTVGPVYVDGTHNEEQLLKKATQVCLKICSERGFQTVSLPAISSGIFGYPPKECAKVMVQTVLDYFQANTQSCLKTVRFTNIDDPTVEVFEKEFERRFAGRLEVPRETGGSGGGGGGRSGASQLMHQDTVPMLARADTIPMDAASKTEPGWYWRADDGSLKPFNDDSSKRLESAFNKPGATTLSLDHGKYKYHVDLRTMKQRNTTTLVARDITRIAPSSSSSATSERASSGDAASSLSSSQTSKPSAAATVAVAWCCHDDNLNPVQYPAAVSADLEKAFTNGDRKTQVVIGGNKYTIDFDTMTQIRESTGYARKVCRQTNKPAATSKQPAGGASTTGAAAGGGEQWYWIDNQKQLVAYPPEIAAKASAAYNEGSTTCEVSINGQPYTLDFKRNVQVRTSTGNERQIKRVAGGAGVSAGSNTASSSSSVGASRHTGGGGDSGGGSSGASASAAAAAQGSSKPSQWLWMGDDHKFTAYDAETSAKLEQAYKSGQSELALMLSGQQYTVDFTKMMQAKKATGFQRRIQRRPAEQVSSSKRSAPWP